MVEVVWKINSFGEFNVIRNGVNITARNKRFSKKWKLFQYLLTHRNKEISHRKLIEVLDLQESVLPKEALSALVYRLRKQLQGKIFNEIDEANQLICRKPGRYYFNRQANYHLDSDIFEEVIADCKLELSKNSNEIDIINTFNNAWDIYRKGDYLETVKHNEDWLISARDYYKSMLINTLRLIRKRLASSSDCYKLENYYQKLLERYSYNIELIIGYINLLICIGDNYFALHKLEYYLASFHDRGLKIPVRLIELQKKLKGNNQVFDLGLALNADFNKNPVGSRDEERDAYLTSAGTFMEFFEIEFRRRFVVNYQSFIVNLSLDNPINDMGIKQEIVDVLKESLRPGDVFSPWDENTILILMVDINSNELRLLFSRLICYLKENYGVNFNFNFTELERPESNIAKT